MFNTFQQDYTIFCILANSNEKLNIFTHPQKIFLPRVFFFD